MKKRHTWAFIGFFCINKHLFNERSPFFIMHNCSAITKQALDLTWPTARRCNSHKKETTHLRGNVKNKNALFCYGKVPLLYMTFWGIYISFELKNSTIVRLLGFFFTFLFFFFFFTTALFCFLIFIWWRCSSTGRQCILVVSHGAPSIVTCLVWPQPSHRSWLAGFTVLLLFYWTPKVKDLVW